MTDKVDKPAGRGMFGSLTAMFGAAAGLLMRELIDASRADPAWIVALVLSFVVGAIIVAFAWTWLTGQIVHIREHLEVKDDRDKWRAMALRTISVNEVAVPVAVAKTTGGEP
jgi:hypothetical protein